jgi:hypothetical protein
MCGKNWEQLVVIISQHMLHRSYPWGLAYYYADDNHFCSLALVTTEYPVLSKTIRVQSKLLFNLATLVSGFQLAAYLQQIETVIN